jgi:hypothetical protein
LDRLGCSLDHPGTGVGDPFTHLHPLNSKVRSGRSVSANVLAGRRGAPCRTRSVRTRCDVPVKLLRSVDASPGNAHRAVRGACGPGKPCPPAHMLRMICTPPGGKAAQRPSGQRLLADGHRPPRRSETVPDARSLVRSTPNNKQHFTRRPRRSRRSRCELRSDSSLVDPMAHRTIAHRNRGLARCREIARPHLKSVFMFPGDLSTGWIVPLHSGRLVSACSICPHRRAVCTANVQRWLSANVLVGQRGAPRRTRSVRTRRDMSAGPLAQDGLPITRRQGGAAAEVANVS